MNVLTAVLMLSVALLIFSLTQIARARRNAGKIPKSLPSWPLIGSLLSLRSDLPPHLLFQKLQKSYGSMFSFMLGSHYVLVINNYEYAKEVLLKKSRIFAGRPNMLTTNLLSRDGKDIAFGNYSPSWKFHRKLVHSAIYLFGDGSASLERMICQEMQSMYSTFEHYLGSPLDIMPEVTRVITNVICMLCFNSKYEKDDPEFQKMLKYSQGIVNTVGKDSLVDIFPWLQLFPNEDLHLLKQSIAVRDSILQKKFEDHKVQKKIQEEIDSKVGLNRTPQLSDRNNMHFLSATISEVLRIQPVSPLLIPHVALADSSIGEYTVPKGTRVIINLWAIHHNEQEWENPHAFDPGRFLDKDGKHIYSPSTSYIPFGAGVRACLGEILARMELFLFISWFLQRFTIDVPPGYPLPSLRGNFGIVLQPEKFKVQLKLRKAWENNK
ncbi:steroid 17-alpha-hydroxylase/17,20 lyase isoform X2 [Stegostoma tigrinum]|uniref:steroid 17-alpha-hydroxylase/17,20 lyase isoform X2 n=1 Tax=Stegostoma tigrinum TaxID=3053191 RepID=UPI00202B51E6|nr:steroid 17-alpha-hydroxylase/17,20 lyase isoform X2 [Stegostoma tigrinum]